MMLVQDGLLSGRREVPHPDGRLDEHPRGHGQQSGQPSKCPRGHHLYWRLEAAVGHH